MTTASKLALLAGRPTELLARVAVKLESWKHRRQSDSKSICEEEECDFSRFVEEAFGDEGTQLLRGEGLIELEDEIALRLSDSVHRRGFNECHNGSSTLGRLCYLAVRLRKPDHVVETGVARGVTSAYILGAMNENKQGQLSSIDLPPLAKDANSLVGCAVPERWRGRWQLHYGTSRQTLPRLLSTYAGRIGLFVHDSLHTQRNMMWEMKMAHAHMDARGIIIADDIECNQAFHQFVSDEQPAMHAVLREAGKPAWCGITLFH